MPAWQPWGAPHAYPRVTLTPVRPALLMCRSVTSTELIRIHRTTVSGCTPILSAKSCWLSPEVRNAHIS
jgi:hypothetical protein